MIANQRLVANDGYEVMLFPLEQLYMTQDEGGNFSHLYTKNIDLVGYNGTSQILHAPIYAPCTCTCVAIWDPGSNNRVFTSNDLVHTPSGLQRVTFAIAHDNNPIANINDEFIQGDLIGHTGTAGNVTGDHTHFNTAIGTYQGYQSHYVDSEHTNYDLIGSVSVWDICYINDTTVYQDYNHNWLIWNETPPTPPTPVYKRKKSKFPWVLYARKLRTRL